MGRLSESRAGLAAHSDPKQTVFFLFESQSMAMADSRQALLATREKRRDEEAFPLAE